MTTIKHDFERTVKAGERLTLGLNESGAGGYLWSNDRCEGVEITSERRTPDKGSFGASSQRVFTIAAASPGEYTITFRHNRPWETDPIDVNTRVMKLIVTPA